MLKNASREIMRNESENQTDARMSSFEVDADDVALAS